MTPEQEISRGIDAERILNEPVFKDAMERMRAEIVSQWAAVSAQDTKGREWLWNHYQVALKFEDILKYAMQTGKMAKLKQEQSLKERAMSIWNR